MTARRRPVSKTPPRSRPPIVCGTDFSDHAQRAANVAAALAATLWRPLLLVHVAQPGPRTSHAAARAALRDEAVRLRHWDAKVSEALLTGVPHEAIVERAREVHAPLIVVASLGRPGAPRARLGGVAERTAEHAGVPTLVVRNDTPFLEWLGGTRRLRVLAAFDFTMSAETALAWSRWLLEIAPCDLVLGYAHSAGVEARRLGLSAERAADARAIREATERDLRAHGERQAGLAVTPRLAPVQDSVSETLAAMAADTDADVLLMGTHQTHGLPRLWHTSVSRGVLHDAAASVVLVPMAAAVRQAPEVPALQRVLVATDFSAAANRAVAHAFAVARPGGVVRLMHVVHPRAISGGVFAKGLMVSPRHLAHVKALRHTLQGLLPRDGDRADLTLEARVVECEDVPTGICQEAERFGADVIVMGSQGLSGVTRTILGSVAQSVMARSRKPLFVVRSPRE